MSQDPKAAIVRPVYEVHLAAKGYNSDPAQLRGVAALERCAQELLHGVASAAGAGLFSKIKGLFKADAASSPKGAKGVYLHGGVGRGKSFLMDSFYAALLDAKTLAAPIPVTRLHFHEFMREVHRELVAMQGTRDPMQALVASMAKRFKVVCLDEFHVADITDAMILYRLLEAMLQQDMVLITTSNFIPDGLYPDGLHRDRLLPAIALLNQHLQVVNVDNDTDYRQLALQGVKLYHTPLDSSSEAAMAAAFEALSEASDEVHPNLHIEGRDIVVRRRAGGLVWFDFAQLCGGTRSQNDYLELVAQFHTVMLSGVPVMDATQASPARRFTWLVDVLYDRRVNLVISAQAAPEQLYTSGVMANEFVRTASRLHEMQSAAFVSQSRREVDTRLA